MKKEFRTPHVMELGTLQQIVLSGSVGRFCDASSCPHMTADPSGAS